MTAKNMRVVSSNMLCTAACSVRAKWLARPAGADRGRAQGGRDVAHGGTRGAPGTTRTSIHSSSTGRCLRPRCRGPRSSGSCRSASCFPGRGTPLPRGRASRPATVPPCGGSAAEHLARHPLRQHGHVRGTGHLRWKKVASPRQGPGPVVRPVRPVPSTSTPRPCCAPPAGWRSRSPAGWRSAPPGARPAAPPRAA